MAKSWFVGVLGEPLLHFVFAGAALFAVFSVVSDPSDASSSGDLIRVTPQEVSALSARFQSSFRRPPTEQELSNLVDDFVLEEVLVREAKALDLERGDAVIRGRLRQKMEILAAARSNDAVPDEPTLRAWHSERADQYVTAASMAFEQVFLGKAPTAADVDRALSRLFAGDEPEEVGLSTLLPFSVGPRIQQQIDGTFGRGFFDAAATLPVAQWAGPVRSGYGIHLLRLISLTPASKQPFAQVKDAVERDWQAARAKELQANAYEKLRARYQIEIPEQLQ